MTTQCQCGHDKENHSFGVRRCLVAGCICQKFNAISTTTEGGDTPWPEDQPVLTTAIQDQSQKDIQAESNAAVPPSDPVGQAADCRICHSAISFLYEREKDDSPLCDACAHKEVDRLTDELEDATHQPIHIDAETRYNLTYGGAYFEMTGKELCEAWKAKEGLTAELEQAQTERDEYLRAIEYARHGSSAMCCQLRLYERQKADALKSELAQVQTEYESICNNLRETIGKQREAMHEAVAITKIEMEAKLAHAREELESRAFESPAMAQARNDQLTKEVFQWAESSDTYANKLFESELASERMRAALATVRMALTTSTNILRLIASSPGLNIPGCISENEEALALIGGGK